jgi:hypothetical protein
MLRNYYVSADSYEQKLGWQGHVEKSCHDNLSIKNT